MPPSDEPEIILDKATILPNAGLLGSNPDGEDFYDEHWTPETDMSRYTDPNHPDFWQPEWAKAQQNSANE